MLNGPRDHIIKVYLAIPPFCVSYITTCSHFSKLHLLAAFDTLFKICYNLERTQGCYG